LGKRDSANVPGAWECSLWTGRVRTLSRAEADRERGRPRVPVAWGLETEPGWQRDLMLWSLASAMGAVAAWRANGKRRIALGITAGVLALPLVSFGVMLALARALQALERETEAADA
jgi:hypothetical protein